eukprot:TRINITY_DN27336_c0_g1_i1.p1 TRINITY_DN27336_c0_g1~~TRINITY_DN27336_c0_g1_i1.p1  ORF type:complete len:564 (+),score=103.35 TRINITY_DN27336_c0_g1_i1:87-1778(+)
MSLGAPVYGCCEVEHPPLSARQHAPITPRAAVPMSPLRRVHVPLAATSMGTPLRGRASYDDLALVSARVRSCSAHRSGAATVAAPPGGVSPFPCWSPRAAEDANKAAMPVAAAARPVARMTSGPAPWMSSSSSSPLVATVVCATQPSMPVRQASQSSYVPPGFPTPPKTAGGSAKLPMPGASATLPMPISVAPLGSPPQRPVRCPSGGGSTTATPRRQNGAPPCGPAAAAANAAAAAMVATATALYTADGMQHTPRSWMPSQVMRQESQPALPVSRPLALQLPETLRGLPSGGPQRMVSASPPAPPTPTPAAPSQQAAPFASQSSQALLSLRPLPLRAPHHAVPSLALDVDPVSARGGGATSSRATQARDKEPVSARGGDASSQAAPSTVPAPCNAAGAGACAEDRRDAGLMLGSAMRAHLAAKDEEDGLPPKPVQHVHHLGPRSEPPLAAAARSAAAAARGESAKLSARQQKSSDIENQGRSSSRTRQASVSKLGYFSAPAPLADRTNAAAGAEQEKTAHRSLRPLEEGDGAKRVTSLRAQYERRLRGPGAMAGADDGCRMA